MLKPVRCGVLNILSKLLRTNKALSTSCVMFIQHLLFFTLCYISKEYAKLRPHKVKERETEISLYPHIISTFNKMCFNLLISSSKKVL